MTDTFADLLREVGISDEPAFRSSVQLASELPRPRRPMPRQMRPQAGPTRAQTTYGGQQGDVSRLHGFRADAARQDWLHGGDLGTRLRGAGGLLLEATGLPSVRAEAEALGRRDWASAGQEAPAAAMTAAGPALGLFGRRAPVAPPRAAPEPVTRLPVNPSRIPTRASDGSVLPAREPQPFRRTEARSDDLRDAAAMRPRESDAGSAGNGQRVVYRGMNKPYDPNNGGYYQSFTSSADDAREYGSQVMAARINPGRNLAVDGGGNNFNALSVEQLPADVRAKLHPSVGSSATTDQIAHAAREAGYDSVTVRNVYDNRWGERPVSGQEPRTIDFVFDTRNITPVDGPIPQAQAAADAGKVRLSDADRALLAELEGFPDPPRPDGGSDGNWIDLHHGSNQLRGPWRGSLWATPNEDVATNYAHNFRSGGTPNVRSGQGDIDGAVTIRDERDLYEALGPDAKLVDPMEGLPHLRNVKSDYFWELLDDPQVQEALRRRGVSVVHLPDDAGPGSSGGRGRHASYLFLDEGRWRDAQQPAVNPRPDSTLSGSAGGFPIPQVIKRDFQRLAGGGPSPAPSQRALQGPGGRLTAMSRAGAPEMRAPGSAPSGLLQTPKGASQQSAIDPRVILGGGALGMFPTGAATAALVRQNAEENAVIDRMAALQRENKRRFAELRAQRAQRPYQNPGRLDPNRTITAPFGPNPGFAISPANGRVLPVPADAPRDGKGRFVTQKRPSYAPGL